MITHKSDPREIGDLQRLLVSLGYLTELDEDERNTWGSATHDAVMAAYRGIGWHRPGYGRWVTMSALAAMAAAGHSHEVERDGKGTGTGRGAAGPGSHAAGPGSHAAGPGSHAAGPGSHAAGPGSHDG